MVPKSYGSWISWVVANSKSSFSDNVMYLYSNIFLIHLMWIIENQLLTVSSICFRYYKKQYKTKAIITTYKELLGTCIKSKKKHIYSMHLLIKVLETSNFATFGSSACQGNFSWHVQLPSFAECSYPTALLPPLLFLKFCQKLPCSFCCLVFLSDCVITPQVMYYFA